MLSTKNSLGKHKLHCIFEFLLQHLLESPLSGFDSGRVLLHNSIDPLLGVELGSLHFVREPKWHLNPVLPGLVCPSILDSTESTLWISWPLVICFRKYSLDTTFNTLFALVFVSPGTGANTAPKQLLQRNTVAQPLSFEFGRFQACKPWPDNRTVGSHLQNQLQLYYLDCRGSFTSKIHKTVTRVEHRVTQAKLDGYSFVHCQVIRLSFPL